MAHPLTDIAVGARLDRAPWQLLHTTVLLALGAGWLFDSFEVQNFSSAIPLVSGQAAGHRTVLRRPPRKRRACPSPTTARYKPRSRDQWMMQLVYEVIVAGQCVTHRAIQRRRTSRRAAIARCSRGCWSWC